MKYNIKLEAGTPNGQDKLKIGIEMELTGSHEDADHNPISPSVDELLAENAELFMETLRSFFKAVTPEHTEEYFHTLSMVVEEPTVLYP